MFYFILFVHVLLCFILIGLVLLQQGKGADMGAALGGGSNTLFGAAGATAFVVKATTVSAVLFMVTSILLIKQYRAATAAEGFAASSVEDRLQGSLLKESVEREVAAVEATSAPATPGVEGNRGAPTVAPAPVAAAAAPAPEQSAPKAESQ